MMKEGWEYKKYSWSDILTIINGKNQKNVQCEDGEYPIYGSGGIMGNANDYLCPENCTIIGRKGNINKPIYVETKFWNVDTAFGLLPNPDYLFPRYLFFFCLNYNFEKLNKAVTIPSLTKSDLLKIEIHLPPLTEQQSIVAELDKINEIIDLKKAQLKDLDLLAQSIFYDMFGDPIENSKGWEVKKLGEVCDFYNGKAHENAIDENGKYLLINSKFIASDAGVVKRTNEQMFPLYMNDITMVMSDVPNGRALAKCYLVKDNGVYTLNQRICAFRNYALNHIYFFKVLNRNGYFLRFNDGNGQTNLRKNDILNCPIPLPPLSLQQSFASKIQAIESQKSAIKQSLAEVETLLASRMDYWFN